ncbi:glycosyltransferase [Porphyrobacter sp. SLTP]|nr:glycosyltransferase family 4 protein [Porphyrobacter sp. SLTP]NBB23583.1 glycosyltransferase [Porphyrobacter sp. SLTP]
MAVVASHPVQYYAPLFRNLAGQLDLTVFYCHQADQTDQARAGFGVGFEWDVDLFSGYEAHFLENVARQPGLSRFGGVDTPAIAEKLRVGRFDAVLLLGWYLKSFLQALWAAKRMGIPTMVRGDSHLDTPRSFLKRVGKNALYPLFLRQFDAALIVGARNKAYWRHYGYPEARMFASPHCVDTDWFEKRATQKAGRVLRQRMGIASTTPVALFAGKLIAFKRPGDLIVAAAWARENGMPVEVLVAGSGPLEAELKALAAYHSVPLHMLGFCNQSQMPAAYAAADVLVLPSNGRETWGLVANEAIACGKPVILSNAVGCAPDLAGDGRAGRTFFLGDTVGCAEVLSETLANPPSLETIAKTSHKHSLDAATDGIIRALQAVVSQR